jgi:1-acyl-sn-glycerol-3-phosphate acyltransferase
MHDMPFSVPAAGAWLNAAGAIAANRINADRALDRGAAVLVFPGGDVDACKPFRDRYKIDFGSRRGFIRLALERRIPIVPVVSAGAHESLFIYSRGDALAQRLRLDKRLFQRFPHRVRPPLGLVVGVPYPHLPHP